MKPHKHAELIKAWADGAEIQVCVGVDEWWNEENPEWHPLVAYRIKPEPKPDVTAYFKSGSINREMTSLGASIGVIGTTKPFANFCLTFDGETGKLKSAEVL